MAELKTKVNDASVEDFLNAITDESKRQDAFTILTMMQQISGAAPKMWGSSIVGFGSYRYKYASGQEGDWMQMGFSPRKQNLTIYIPGSTEAYQTILAQLGKHTCGKGCLYIKRLKDVDLTVLRQLIATSMTHVQTSQSSAYTEQK